METKELKITIPEGHKIDWQESAKQEKIVFKKKEDTKPRSWEEYCKLQASKHAKGYFMDSDSNQHNAEWDRMTNPIMWRTVLPSKELVEASRAMMQLMSLRQSWIGDWKPNLIDYTLKYCICISYGELKIDYTQHHQYPLSFSTREMATDFRNSFKDLLEIAKPLI